MEYSPEPIVIKVSGSFFDPYRSGGLDVAEYIDKLSIIIKKLYNNKYKKIVIVVGGGGVSRKYIQLGDKLKINNSFKDILGIMISKVNALLLSLKLYPLTNGGVAANLDEILRDISLNKISVSGGWEPGHSTNAVALISAEAIGAKTVYNLLNGVGGVIVDDKIASYLTYDELEKIVSKFRQVPGGYTLIDHIALEIARRSNIKIHFLDGSDPNNLEKIILYNEKIGTIIGPSKQ